MFRLRIDPSNHWLACLQARPIRSVHLAYESGEKSRYDHETHARQDGCVITFRPLLQLEHYSAQAVLRKARSLNTDKQNIPMPYPCTPDRIYRTAAHQLSIRNSVTPSWTLRNRVTSTIKLVLVVKVTAKTGLLGSSDWETVRRPRLKERSRRSPYAVSSSSRRSSRLSSSRYTQFLADFGAESGNEGSEPTRGSEPHCHRLCKRVRLLIEEDLNNS